MKLVMGTVAYWLRHSGASLKVAGSRSDEVDDNCQVPNRSGRYKS
jgi:hypothetical protein